SIVGAALAQYIDAVERGLADTGDPWEAFARFMAEVVDADLHAMTLRLAGAFEPTPELNRDGMRAGQLNAQLFARTQAAGAIRAAPEATALAFLLEQLASVGGRDPRRWRGLRGRSLALTRAAVRPGGEPLPGPPPTWEENTGRWQPGG